MSIQKLNPEDFEYFTIETYPSRSYSKRLERDISGSIVFYTASNGSVRESYLTTGSVFLFTNRNNVEKELFPLGGGLVNTTFKDEGIELLRQQIANNTSTDISSQLNTYMSLVNETTSSLRKQTKKDIVRIIPPFNFNINFLTKKLITNHLIPYYRTQYNNCNFGVTNYNSLHFFKAKNTDTFQIPENTAILYPNPASTLISSGVYTSQYGFKEDEAFSFDFWVKPSYKNTGSYYEPGTILHLSGAYAISIHSGSSQDVNGKADKFKICLQLGSAGTGFQPSELSTSDIPNGIIFTNDNVIEYNKWHHVSIAHGGQNYNNSSGSIYIDGVKQGDFYFNNNGFALHSGTNQPNALCIGTFYNGSNALAEFFNTNSSLRDGLQEISSDPNEPVSSLYSFVNHLQGELHDIKIYNKYLTAEDVNYLQSNAPSSLTNIKFYLPPFFTEESPYRQFVNTHGGVLLTPFQERDGSTTKPFASELAFAVGGHYINLENYLRDFSGNQYPRLWNLTGSTVEPPSSVIEEANYFLYDSGSSVGSIKKRLYTILPNDHGNWIPNYSILETMSGANGGGIYSNDLGIKDIVSINLNNIVTDNDYSTTKGIIVSSSILTDVLGASPENFSVDVGNSLTMLHRLRDNSSNQVVMFDISNLFYGNQIKPNSLILTDTNLSGSDGRVKITIKDDGRGNLYRADTYSEYATWNSVGNIFYNEGLLLIKSPQLFFFGKEGFDISFKGVHNIHNMKISAVARSYQLISSSNPTYVSRDYDEDLANEPDQKFVYITSVNIHDENLNVIARTHLAQPIKKLSGDQMVFKISLDY